MKIIITERGGGKTTILMRESARTGYHIVCSPVTLDYILSLASSEGRRIPRPITFDEFINKDYNGKSIKGFIIDDADLLLQTLTEKTIKWISVSSNDGRF